MRRMTYVFVVGLIGLFLFLLGIGFAWFGTRNLIRMWAWEKLTIKNNSEAMARWLRPPVPVLMKVYIFNVTNAEAVSEGALPILSEVGPYVYEQVREKVNVKQLENFTLSYQLKNIIKFKPNLSGKLKESDLVTILNVPLAGAILTVYETVPEFVGLLDDIWQLFYPGQKNIFITTSVKELLFDGITIDCTSRITEVYVACRGLESRKSYSIRKEGKNFKFSFFHAKNGTSSDTYQISQGITDLKKSAQFIGMNYSPSVKIWKNKYCDLINGSDGAQFSILLNKAEKLYIFEKELCRSVYAEFEKEIMKNGVLLYKFSNTASLFASPEENPDNSCFCRSPLTLKDLVGDENDEENENFHQEPKICFQNGILPLMPCVGKFYISFFYTTKLTFFIISHTAPGLFRFFGTFLLQKLLQNVDTETLQQMCFVSTGAPMVASFPHFYLGDQSYLNYSGLTPVKDLHETFIYVEPLSGMGIFGFKRIQFNLEVKRISDVQITSNLVDGLFPILWVEEELELPANLFKILKYSLIEKKILENGTYVLIVFGLVLVMASYFSHFLMKKSFFCEKIHDVTWRMEDSELQKGERRARLEIWKSSNTSVFPSGSTHFNFIQ